MSDIYEKLINDKTYQELIKQLPDDERAMVVKALKEIVETFQKGLLDPIKNFKGK